VEAVIDPGTLTDDENDAIYHRRNAGGALHDCKQMASIMCALARADRDSLEFYEPDAVFWLANRLCDRLDQLEENLK